MHVLFLTPAFPPFPGGGERYAASLSRELTQQGHRVTVVTSAAQVESELWLGTVEQQVVAQETGGIQVIRCPIRPFPGGRTGLLAWRKGMALLSTLPGDQTAVLNRMARLIPPLHRLEETLLQLTGNFDLVHCFNLSWEYPSVAGWQYAQQHRIPFIVTPYTHLGTGHDRVARNSTMDHQIRLIGNANRVLTLTAIEKDGLAALGVPRTQLDVIHGGLDPLPPLPDTAVLQEHHGLQQPYIIFIGRASYEKGAIHAAQAVLALQKKNMAVNLVLVGQMAPEFERFMKRLDDEERVNIRPLGILSDSDKHGLLAGAKALLMPSRTDSFGIVFLEAWAHGKPVIGARSGGIPGVIDEGKNGLLVEFGAVSELASAIALLWQNDALQHKLGQHGQQKVTEHYTWEQTGRRVLANYEQVI